MAQGRSLVGRALLSAGAPAVSLRRLLLTLIASLVPALVSAQTGTTFITGTVTDAASAPVAGLMVRACSERPFGVICFQDATDESGHYAIDLTNWSFRLFTTGNLTERALVNEVYDNVACPGVCGDKIALGLGGALVDVPADTTVERNIQLSQGGTLSGAVTDAATSAPLRQVIVSAYTAVGDDLVFAGAATTNTAGLYSIGGLTGGTHVAFTSNAIGYTNEIYDNILCFGECSSSTAVVSGAPIPISLGATTANRNFALARGGGLLGIVRSNTNFAAINGAVVDVYARVNGAVVLVASTSTGASGLYLASGLPTGTYYAVARARFHVAEVFGEVLCAVGCTPTVVGTGTPIPVTAGEAVLVDFGLDRGGRVFGTVIIDGGVLGSGINVSACTVQGSTVSCTRPDSAVTTAGGSYEITGLPPGSYFIHTTNAGGFVDEVHDNVACVGSCLGPATNWSIAAPVAVTAETNVERHFDLAFGAFIGGVVTHGGTAKRLPAAPVSLFDGAGKLLLTEETDELGRYEITSVPAGTYRLATDSTAGVVNEAWDNAACATSGAPCDTATITAGTPVIVTSFGVFDANFTLAPATAAPHAPANPGATVDAGTVRFSWDPPVDGPTATGYVVEVGTTPGTTAVTFETAETSFTVPGAPAGRFYARIKATNAFGTGPASAEFTLVINADGSGIPNPPTGVDAFMSGGRLTMTWAAPAIGGPVTGYVVEAGSATGRSDIATLPVATTSFVFDPVPTGFYFLRVRARLGSQLSAPSNEVMINVGNVPSPPSAPQEFTSTVSGSQVTLTWEAAQGTVTGYALQVSLEPGGLGSAPFAFGNVLTATFNGVPPGTYYIKLHAFNSLGASVASNERIVTVQ